MTKEINGDGGRCDELYVSCQSDYWNDLPPAPLTMWCIRKVDIAK